MKKNEEKKESTKCRLNLILLNLFSMITINNNLLLSFFIRIFFKIKINELIFQQIKYILILNGFLSKKSSNIKKYFLKLLQVENNLKFKYVL